MKPKKNIYSKYSDEDKLDIYSKKPLNKKDFLKNISKVKSKYMQDYKDSNKTSKYIEEKKFNNLLTAYFEDYNNLRSKYKFKNDVTQKNINLEYDIKDFNTKQQNLNRIISGDLNEIKDFNFDLCDNLINDLPKDNNNSIIKTLQNKEDYELRLQGFPHIKKNEIQIIKEENNNEQEDNINNDIQLKNKNNINENEKKESFEYLEDSMQFNEDNGNYLKLNQQNLDDELPLFENIISNNYNKEYKAPFYEHDKIEKEEKEKEEKEEEKEEKEENYDDFVNKEEEVDINRLILENKNNEYMLFENIIESDFDKDYKIPEYKIPNKIKEEIEKEKENEENKKLIYEQNKNSNNLIQHLNNENQDENINNNLQKVNDIIKNEEDDFIEVKPEENEKKKEEDKINTPQIKNEINNVNKNINNDDGQFEEINVDELNDNEDEDNNDYNDFEK